MSQRSLKLGTQLGAAFAVVVALTLALGAFALQRLYVVNGSTEDLAKNWLPSVAVLGELRGRLNQVRRAESEHVMAVNASDLAESGKALAAARQHTAEQLAAYEPLVASPAERAAYQDFRQKLDRYYEQLDHLLALTAGQAEAGGQARALFMSGSKQAFNAMIEQQRQLVEINQQGGHAASTAARAVYDTAWHWTLGLLSATALAAAALAWWIVRAITRQLGGEPAQATELAQRVADGDLSVPITLRAGDSASMMAALKRMQDSLSDLVQKVRGNAEGVASASSQIAQGTTDLSSRTEEQAAALEQTAASMKELGATVEQNAGSAREGSRLAGEASGLAVHGGEVVGQVVETMRGIQDSSRRIADIIGVIDGIAFQTNILALNAAVEAARAGEQGRGFAVVAGEVRTLAQRSAEAAKEIKALITDSVGRVDEGSELVSRAGLTMKDVVASIQHVSQIIENVSGASVQQTAGVAQIGEAIGQMDTATQQNAALVEESAAAADSLKQQAEQLVQAVAVFKLAGGRAIAPLAAATRAPASAAATGAKVVRPRFGTASAAADTRTGTDHWSSF